MSNTHPPLLQRLRDAVGEAGLVFPPDTPADDAQAFGRRWQGRSQIVVCPRDTAQTSAVMAICHETRTPVVSVGRHTRMTDESHAPLVLSLARLNRIRAIDAVHRRMTVEAGVLLSDLIEAAARSGLTLPLGLEVAGDGTLGGCLATYPGGAKLSHGSLRNALLGLEVVMPDGRVWNGLCVQRHDPGGYDLRPLFIGTEGTLGVITAAVWSATPRALAEAATPHDTGLPPCRKSALELELMMRIKQALDPNHLMNPGKMF